MLCLKCGDDTAQTSHFVLQQDTPNELMIPHYGYICNKHCICGECIFNIIKFYVENNKPVWYSLLSSDATHTFPIHTHCLMCSVPSHKTLLESMPEIVFPNIIDLAVNKNLVYYEQIPILLEKTKEIFKDYYGYGYDFSSFNNCLSNNCKNNIAHLIKVIDIDNNHFYIPACDIHYISWVERGYGTMKNVAFPLCNTDTKREFLYKKICDVQGCKEILNDKEKKCTNCNSISDLQISSLYKKTYCSAKTKKNLDCANWGYGRADIIEDGKPLILCGLHHRSYILNKVKEHEKSKKLKESTNSEKSKKGQCTAVTLKGLRCKNNAIKNKTRCKIHYKESEEEITQKKINKLLELPYNDE